MLKVKLGKREVAKKKRQAEEYKGISYDAGRDEFIVRYRIGTDINGKPIYFLPIRRYNEIGKAVLCLENYKELAAKNLARKKTVTLETLHQFFYNKIDEIKKHAKENPASDEALTATSRIATLQNRINVLNVIKRTSPVLYKKSLEKIEEGEIQELYKQIFNDKNSNLSPRVLSDYFSRLKGMVLDNENGVTTLLREAGIRVNPENFRIYRIKDRMEKDVNPAEKQQGRRYSIEELNKMYQTAMNRAMNYGSLIDDRAYLAVLLSITSGARVNELLNITVGKIKDTDSVLGSHIEIYRQRSRLTGKEAVAKTKQSNRPLPICGYVNEILTKYIMKYKLNDEDKLFFTDFENKGDALADVTVSRYLKNCEKMAGVEHIEGRTNHAHRNDLITFFEGVLGVDEGTVRYFVGHRGRRDAHQKYFKDDDDNVKRIRAKRFRAAQYAYIMTVLNNYSADKAVEIYKQSLNRETLQDAVHAIVTDYDMEDYEEIYKHIQNGKTGAEIIAEMGIGDNNKAGSPFSDKIYAYNLWRPQIAEAYRTMNRKIREEYPTVEEFLIANKDSFEDYYFQLFASSLKIIKPQEETDEEREVKKILDEELIKMAEMPEMQVKWYIDEKNATYRENNSFENFIEDLSDEQNTTIRDEYLAYVLNLFLGFMSKYKEGERLKELCKKWYKF